MDLFITVSSNEIWNLGVQVCLDGVHTNFRRSEPELCVSGMCHDVFVSMVLYHFMLSCCTMADGSQVYFKLLTYCNNAFGYYDLGWWRMILHERGVAERENCDDA